MKPFEHMRAIRDAELPATVRAVAWAIALRADQYGSAHPGAPRIAADTGLTPRTVLRAVQTLESTGWVHVVRTTGRHGKQANRYLLTTPVDNSPDVSETSVSTCHRITSDVTQDHVLGRDTGSRRRSPQEKNSGEQDEPAKVHPHLAAIIGTISSGMKP